MALSSYVLLVILGSGLVTWLSRVVPFILLKQFKLPKIIELSRLRPDLYYDGAVDGGYLFSISVSFSLNVPKCAGQYSNLDRR